MCLLGLFIFQDLTVQQRTPIRVLHRSGYMAFLSQDFFKSKGKILYERSYDLLVGTKKCMEGP